MDGTSTHERLACHLFFIIFLKLRCWLHKTNDRACLFTVALAARLIVQFYSLLKLCCQDDCLWFGTDFFVYTSVVITLVVWRLVLSMHSACLDWPLSWQWSKTGMEGSFERVFFPHSRTSTAKLEATYAELQMLVDWITMKWSKAESLVFVSLWMMRNRFCWAILPDGGWIWSPTKQPKPATSLVLVHRWSRLDSTVEIASWEACMG